MPLKEERERERDENWEKFGDDDTLDFLNFIKLVSC